MHISYHNKFISDLDKFPDGIKKKLKKQIIFLSKNIRHPSLHAKKYNESLDIWQVRSEYMELRKIGGGRAERGSQKFSSENYL